MRRIAADHWPSLRNETLRSAQFAMSFARRDWVPRLVSIFEGIFDIIEWKRRGSQGNFITEVLSPLCFMSLIFRFTKIMNGFFRIFQSHPKNRSARRRETPLIGSQGAQPQIEKCDSLRRAPQSEAFTFEQKRFSKGGIIRIDPTRIFNPEIQKNSRGKTEKLISIHENYVPPLGGIEILN
jgi:hypothetical protein